LYRRATRTVWITGNERDPRPDNSRVYERRESDKTHKRKMHVAASGAGVYPRVLHSGASASCAINDRARPRGRVDYSPVGSHERAPVPTLRVSIRLLTHTRTHTHSFTTIYTAGTIHDEQAHVARILFLRGSKHKIRC